MNRSRVRRTGALLLLPLLAIGCSQAKPAAKDTPAPAPTERQTPAATVEILDGPDGLSLLHQCSRITPAPGEATWHPGDADIAALEATLPSAFHGFVPNGFDPATWRQHWSRSYVGLVRKGHRYIYGSFGPDGFARGVCDGGSAFFGVEYDIENRKFTHVAFNGDA